MYCEFGGNWIRRSRARIQIEICTILAALFLATDALRSIKGLYWNLYHSNGKFSVSGLEPDRVHSNAGGERR